MTDHLTNHIRQHITEQEEDQLNSPLLGQLRSDVTRMMEEIDNMYYILKRDNDYQIIRNTSDISDPLYGYGSWDLFGGPYNTWDEAQDAWAEAIATEPLN